VIIGKLCCPSPAGSPLRRDLHPKGPTCAIARRRAGPSSPWTPRRPSLAPSPVRHRRLRRRRARVPRGARRRGAAAPRERLWGAERAGEESGVNDHASQQPPALALAAPPSWRRARTVSGAAQLHAGQNLPLRGECVVRLQHVPRKALMGRVARSSCERKRRRRLVSLQGRMWQTLMYEGGPRSRAPDAVAGGLPMAGA
jgi:hypothetical protein